MCIENNKITDSNYVLKGLCRVIVKLIVKLSPLRQSPSNYSIIKRTNPGRRSQHKKSCHHVGVTTASFSDKHHEELLFLSLRSS